jgi:hypothetical protein
MTPDWWSDVLEGARRAVRDYVRARREGCLRCGRKASLTCPACGARVCDRCWLPSIETGSVAFLCLDCIAPAAAKRSTSLARVRPAELFRAGTRTFAWVAAVALVVAYLEYGWSGPWRLVAALLDPTITLALVPLAFLLGAVRVGVVRAVRLALSARSDSTS